MIETSGHLPPGPLRPHRDAGLSAAQVAERAASGQGNDVSIPTSRSVKDIIRANVLTRINAILGALLVVALAAGSPVDALFGLLILTNSGIGILQEVRAKQTLDRLAVLNQAKPMVRRDGAVVAIDSRQVVTDDIIEVGAGDQVLVDGMLIEGLALELDESLLTGEAEPVTKSVGASLLSGSFVVAGKGAYRATAVGAEAYSARLTRDARRFALAKSELRAGIDRILALVTLLIVPAGALIIYTQIFLSGEPVRPALLGMVAALAPMVPEGLVLMTSIALALGVIRLGQMNCLVQELAAIELLARVDVLCIDKTGTLTEPSMTLAELIPLAGADEALARRALASLAAVDPQPNTTMAAIRAGLQASPFDDPVTQFVPFSSGRKWQGAAYLGRGSWVLGAPDVLLDPASAVAQQAKAIGAHGLRVVMLGEVDDLPKDGFGPGLVTPRLLVALSQTVRREAEPTLAYFARQGVAIKVLSGDNVASVQAVARAVRLEHSDKARDARELASDPGRLAKAMEEISVFGRVGPEQKRAMVMALQSKGHTVAMLGDGVNDVLALKQADIGVAMGSGTSMARGVARIVLLDNNFATLPRVVGEGRRVIGNVERIASLFLTKTVYSAILALIIGTWGIAALLLNTVPLSFPFLPRHIMISAWFTIGIPAFILSLAPTNDRVVPGFVARVLKLALPAGVIVSATTFLCYLLVSPSYGLAGANKAQSATAALICLIVSMLEVLSVVSRPYEWWKLALIGASVLGYVVLFGWPWTQHFFALDVSNLVATAVGLIGGLIGALLIELSSSVGRTSRGFR